MALATATSRIRNKLFATLVGANALLALLIYLGSSWSFDRDFRDYITRQEEVRLTRLVHALSLGYVEHGNWEWITRQRSEWFRLIRENLGAESGFPRPPPRVRPDGPRPPPGERPDGPRPPPGERADGPRPPPHDRPGGPPGPPPTGTLTLSPFLLLLDAQKNVLEGPGHIPAGLELRPIKVEDAIVGYLGFSRRTEFVQAIDRVFATQQNRNFVFLALAMLVTAIVLGAGIAQHLAKPIQQLARGTAELIRGRYDARTKVNGTDELAQLAADFNKLAETLQANRIARRQWIADIAHELRTPLAVLRAEIEAMQDGIRPVQPGNLSSLSQEVQRLSQLVGDLQTLSMSDLGALSYDKSFLDLAELVTELIDAQRDALTEAGITVETVPAGKTEVFGDALRLQQMLNNLLQVRLTTG